LPYRSVATMSFSPTSSPASSPTTNSSRPTFSDSTGSCDPLVDACDSNVILAIVPSVLFAVVGIALFASVRARNKDVYEQRLDDATKRKVRRLTGHSAPPPLRQGWFAWVGDVLSVSDDDVLDICGLDALVFVRFLRMSFFIMAINFVVGLLVLIPLYTQHDEEGVTGVNYYSLANVPPQSWDTWGSVVFAYFFAATSCYALYREFQFTADMRHRFLTKDSPHQFTVLVENIPEELRTSADLQAKFEEFHPGTVQQAYVLMDTSELAAAVKEAKDVVQRLIKARKRQSNSQTGEATHVEGTCWARCMGNGRTVPSVEYLEDKLIALNKKIGNLQKSLLDQKSLQDGIALEKQAETTGEGQNPSSGFSTEVLRTEALRVTLAGANAVIDTARQTPEYLMGALTKRNGMGSTGFVTFKFLTAATIAQQTHYSSRPLELTVRAAPSPRDILWENMSITSNERKIRTLITYGLFAGLVLVWGVPVVIIGGLTSITTVSSEWEALGNVVGQSTIADNLITLQLPSLFLLLYMQALHPLLNFITREAGLQAYSWLQLSVAPTFFFFMVFNQLFVISFSGLVTKGIQDILEDPLSISSILGTSLPALGAFYITYVLTLGLVGLVLRAFMVHATTFVPSWDAFSEIMAGDIDMQKLVGINIAIDYGREFPMQLIVFVLCVVII
jgi:hypothetical protein